jgi:hypothetical protein
MVEAFMSSEKVALALALGPKPVAPLVGTVLITLGGVEISAVKNPQLSVKPPTVSLTIRYSSPDFDAVNDFPLPTKNPPLVLEN